jgi:hypothetical protein
MKQEAHRMTTRSVLSDSEIEAWLGQAVALGYERPERLAHELQQARAALKSIRDNYGQVCPEYETCTHPWCASSYGAWATADAYLPVEEP